MKCPICNTEVSGTRGLAAHFRHNQDTHPPYAEWKEAQKWVDKIENEDYVVCLECGHKAATLACHLKAAHGITAVEYKAKHGSDVLIRARKLTQKRKKAFKKGRQSAAYQGTKTIACPTCGKNHEVSKFSQVIDCPACKQAKKDLKWAGKSEPEDYVTCLECGHRAVNLTSHITTMHLGYREKYPDAEIVALNAGQRDNPLLGVQLSDATRQKMSENAGRWNKGLTKETDPRVAAHSEKMLGKPSWSKGLTAKDDPRLAETSRKLRQYVGENRPWADCNSLNLSWDDLKPFINGNGRVDHRQAMEDLGVCEATLRKYLARFNLKTCLKYVQERVEASTIRLEKETLETFSLGNGKVHIGRAMVGLGHSYSVIKRECDRNDLPTFHLRIRQNVCLKAVSEALGGVPYVEEWESVRFRNPPTGRRFRFDGYFKEVGLIVEFHGHQHYTFPSFYYKESNEAGYLAQRKRDQIKRDLIANAQDLILMEVREDEPYDNPDYLRGRLYNLLT